MIATNTSGGNETTFPSTPIPGRGEDGRVDGVLGWGQFRSNVSEDIRTFYGIDFDEIADVVPTAEAMIGRAYRTNTPSAAIAVTLCRDNGLVQKRFSGEGSDIDAVREENLHRIQALRLSRAGEPRIKPYREFTNVILAAPKPVYDVEKASYLKKASDAMKSIFEVKFIEVFKHVDPGLSRMADAMRRKIAPMEFVRGIGQKLGFVRSGNDVDPAEARSTNLRIAESVGHKMRSISSDFISDEMMKASHENDGTSAPRM